MEKGIAHLVFQITWIIFLTKLICVHCITREYPMDSPSTCGQTLTIYDNIFLLTAQSAVSNPNPPSTCAVTLNTGYTDSYYFIKVEHVAISIKDCAVMLNIFAGGSAGGTPLKSFSCSNQETTGLTLPRENRITIQFTRPREYFHPGNHFNLRITTYRDPDAPALAEGTSSLPTGAIIGIVIAAFVFIAFCIVMCWCYKQGKLGFLEQQKAYQYKASNDNLNKSSINGSTNFYPESEVSVKTTSEFNLNNKEMWASLTNTPTSVRRQPRPVSIPVAPPVPVAGARSVSEKKDWEGGSQTTDTDVFEMSGSPSMNRRRPGEPPRGRRTTKGGVNGDNGNNPRTFTNTGYDDENNENIERELPRGRRARARDPDDTSVKQNAEGMIGELKRELSRRESMREAKEKGEDKKETLIDDAPGAPATKTSPRRTRRNKDGREVPEVDEDIDKKKYYSVEQESEIGDGDRIENPLMRGNPAIRASVSSLRSRGDDSPGTKKKKRKKKRYVSVSKDPTKKNQEPLDNSADSLPDPPSDPYDSIPFISSHTNNLPLPPEAMAPVFATDPSTMQHYYPYTQDGQQGIPVLVGYDANGYPVHSYVNPQMISAQYLQPGSLEGLYYDPNYPGYVIDQAGNYIPLNDGGNIGFPGFTSTPGHDPQQYGVSPIRPHKSPHTAGVMSPAGMPYNSIVPSGTILDDPSVPPPGGTMVRSAVDPVTGSQINQVLWTDSKRDPTDPPPGTDNPQITRKTIVRVTTKATEDGHLPNAPDPALQEMSFNAANQIRAGGEEPAFLSPSKSKPKSYHSPYVHKPMFASETPERDNAAFYTRLPPAESHSIPGGPSIVRSTPSNNSAFKDKIVLPVENDTEI